MITTDATVALIERLGWRFGDPDLVHRALAHRSWCAEHPGEPSNERLEFLGDAVLGVIITDYLFTEHPDRPEGWLSPARASLVRGGTLASIAKELDVGAAIRLGKGEELTGGREKPSILADAVEALIGAVYLDGGIDAASALVRRLYGDRLTAIGALTLPTDQTAVHDHKSRLQEHCARVGRGAPEYPWTESGPEHAKTFVVTVTLDGVAVGHGEGRSKKQAEQRAAHDALHALGVRDLSEDLDADTLISTTPEPE